MAIKDEVLSKFSGRSVLVTGGTGMIGRQVVDILCNAGAIVRIVSLDKLTADDRAEHFFGDLTNFEFCKDITKGMEFVFHLAGVAASVQVSEKKLASHFVPMLMMNTNTLEACRLNSVKKILYTSSVGAYAHAEVFKESDYRLDSIPMDFGGWAKRMAEAQIYAYGVQYGLDNFSVVRPSNVYGPGGDFHPENSLVIPSLMYRIFHNVRPLIVWGDGTAVRDFVYSRDVAEGIILAQYYGTKGSFINLGSGKPCSIKELLETLKTFIDFEYAFDPSKPKGAKTRLMDISLARNMVQYNPSTSLASGLKKTWEWFVNNPEDHSRKKNYFL